MGLPVFEYTRDIPRHSATGSPWEPHEDLDLGAAATLGIPAERNLGLSD